MKSRLSRIRNWAELARAANYRTKELAERCNVSVRELERFFACELGKGPHEWLNELRQMEALALIGGGMSVKETAIVLGYAHPAHFSRDFKEFHGKSPTTIQTTTSLPRAL